MGKVLLASGGAEIDFYIHGVFPYQLFGQTLWITTTHVALVIVMLILIAVFIAANRVMKKATDVPGGLQNFFEMIVDALDGFTATSLGRHAAPYRNYIGFLFIFVISSNVSGLLGLRPPTADYGVTLALAVISFFIINVSELKYQKVSGFIKGLLEPMPFFLPLNIVGKVALPISMSLRLFANLLSGTIMMTMVYVLMGSIAYVWPALLHGFFDIFVGAIQTLVFCILTLTYIGGAVDSD